MHKKQQLKAGRANLDSRDTLYALPFNVLNDLEPVALLPSVPYWMIARKTLPPNSLQELVACSGCFVPSRVLLS